MLTHHTFCKMAVNKVLKKILLQEKVSNNLFQLYIVLLKQFQLTLWCEGGLVLANIV